MTAPGYETVVSTRLFRHLVVFNSLLIIDFITHYFVLLVSGAFAYDVHGALALGNFRSFKKKEHTLEQSAKVWWFIFKYYTFDKCWQLFKIKHNAFFYLLHPPNKYQCSIFGSHVELKDLASLRSFLRQVYAILWKQKRWLSMWMSHLCHVYHCWGNPLWR